MQHQPEGSGGGDLNKHQPQDRRLKTMQGDGQPQPQPQQTQKCPRCESLNTKFCYYNNYSLSQPRYFCKACRRYWTQGGTLRNVRVGGGCRKGKRAKCSSSSSETPRSQPQQLPQEVVPKQPNLRAKDPSAVGSPSAAVPSVSPFYQGGGGGYLASLAAIHSMNPSQLFNQSPNVGGDVVGSSNLGLLSGFNVPSLGAQHQQQRQIRPSQLYPMGIRDREVESLYQAEPGLIQSSMANSSSASRHDWPQSFINHANRRASDASLWSTTMSTTSTSGNSESNVSAGSFSFIPNQWPDLPGYDPPP